MSDKRTGKNRRATRDKVIRRMEYIFGTVAESRLWGTGQWVECLKSFGLIAPATNACDCRTVIRTVARFKERLISNSAHKSLGPDIVVLSSEKADYWRRECERLQQQLKAKEQEIARVREAAFANAAERDWLAMKLKDARIDLQRALDWVDDSDDSDESQILVLPMRAKYWPNGEREEARQ